MQVNKTSMGQVSDMDLRLLQVFRAVVDCGGMAAAELELNIGNRLAPLFVHHVANFCQTSCDPFKLGMVIGTIDCQFGHRNWRNYYRMSIVESAIMQRKTSDRLL